VTGLVDDGAASGLANGHAGVVFPGTRPELAKPLREIDRGTSTRIQLVWLVRLREQAREKQFLALRAPK